MTTESGAKSRLSCAVVVGADGKYRALVATDAEAITVMGKPYPVLVHRHTDALYGVPVRPVTLAVREGVAKSAKQIALSLSMYSQDYDALMPLAAHDVAKDIAPYLKSDNVFRDPRTGENAFTYTYTGIAGADGRKALFTLKTGVGTYRAFLTSTGETVTERIDGAKP